MRGYRIDSYLDNPTSGLAVLIKMEWLEESLFGEVVSNLELLQKGLEDFKNFTDIVPGTRACVRRR